MRSEDLTPQQCQNLAGKFVKMQGELGQLLNRMRTRRFPNSDQLQQLTVRAFESIQELRMHAHYLGCSGTGGSGATEPPKFEDAPLPQPHEQPEPHGNERRGD